MTSVPVAGTAIRRRRLAVVFSDNHPSQPSCDQYLIHCGYFECVHGHVKRLRIPRGVR